MKSAESLKYATTQNRSFVKITSNFAIYQPMSDIVCGIGLQSTAAGFYVSLVIQPLYKPAEFLGLFDFNRLLGVSGHSRVLSYDGRSSQTWLKSEKSAEGLTSLLGELEPRYAEFSSREKYHEFALETLTCRGGQNVHELEGVAYTECIRGLYADAERHLHMGIEAASQMPDDWEWVRELKGRLRLIDGHLQSGRFQEVDAQFDTWRAFTLRRCKLTKVPRIKLGDG